MARWAAVTYRRSDRGISLVELAEAIRRSGIRLAGFFQLSRQDEEGRRSVELVRIATGERISLGQSGPKQAEDGCSFVFRAESFAAARRWLEEDAPEAEVLFLHEVSKLELEGKGHHAAIRWAVCLPDRWLVVLCACGERLEQVVEQHAPSQEPVAYLELPATLEEQARFLRELAEGSVPGASAGERAPR